MNESPTPSEPGRRRESSPGVAIHPSGWTRWVPGWRMLKQYHPSWLRHDIVAGLVMTTMLVPVGIAYAEASGLPGINGPVLHQSGD